MPTYDEGYHDALADVPRRNWGDDRYRDGWYAGTEERRRRASEREEDERRDRERQERELESAREHEENQERRTQEMLDAMEAETEARRADIADAWRLKSDSKAESASELYDAGMFEQSLRLAFESIGENGEGDPTNIKGNMIAAWALEKLGRHPEANKYFSAQISLLRTPSHKQHPNTFLQVLKNLPANNGLLQQFSRAIEQAASGWRDPHTYPQLIDALIRRGLSSVAQTVIQTISQYADSPAYYPVIDNLLKHRLFSEAQVLTASLMRKRNSLELEAYWLETHTRSGAAIEDRISQFLASVPEARREEIINGFNTIASQRDRFSDSTLTWIRDRIAERDQAWLAERNQIMSQRNQQWANQTQAATTGGRVWPWVLGGGAILFLVGIAVVVGMFAIASSSTSNNATSNRNNTNSMNINRRATDPGTSNIRNCNPP
jgi:hypothetical protein